MQNTGDDALLAATILGAKRHFGHNKILVSSNETTVQFDESVVVSTLKSEPMFPGQNRLIHYMNALRSEQVIFGGGSVLHSARDLDLKRHLIALTANKKGFALGVGIEDFKTAEDELACMRFLNACTVVATRDAQSFEIAKKLAPNANIVEAFDLAPMLASVSSFNENICRRGVCINLCPLFINAMGSRDYLSEDKLISAIATAIQMVWEETKEPITLMSFNGHQHQSDEILLQRVYDLVSNTVPVKRIAYSQNPLKTLQQIKRFKIVMGMRLHFNVFAYLTGTPCISLNYHPKSEAWCKQIGKSERFQMNAFYCNTNSLIDATLSILRGEEKRTDTLPISTAVAKANSNWELSL